MAFKINLGFTVIEAKPRSKSRAKKNKKKKTDKGKEEHEKGSSFCKNDFIPKSPPESYQEPCNSI